MRDVSVTGRGPVPVALVAGQVLVPVARVPVTGQEPVVAHVPQPSRLPGRVPV